MPAEAIHLSALSDSIVGSSAEKLLRTKTTREAAKVGAMFVDMPYFESFPLVVIKYLLKRPVAVAAWGDRFHYETPVSLGIAFLRGAQRLLEKSGSREAGEWSLGMALGYFSHLAVDSAIHPSVNRLAQQRALALQDTTARQHNEVEKFQSILYHEERHGFDFMGEPFLAHYIKTQPEPIWSDSEISSVIFPALQEVFGRAITPKLFKNWSSGYRQYGALISSALGKTIAPPKQKEQMHPEVYQSKSEGAFTEKFKVAVWRSRRYIDAALSFVQHQLSEEQLLQIAPEGSIDNPPYPSETIEEG
jgi:hypothetical protein